LRQTINLYQFFPTYRTLWETGSGIQTLLLFWHFAAGMYSRGGTSINIVREDAMRDVGQIATFSKEQVSAAIRYLDPDLNDAFPESPSHLFLIPAVLVVAELIPVWMILSRW
jgi:hypothetical protein